MVQPDTPLFQPQHEHIFLGAGHARAERQTWFVIWLCGLMMAVEIIGGMLFGSLALVADGLHMSTHASALLLAALAYRYARRHAGDRRFTFGTGKLGDLAGFTSAVILAMIALLIGYEAVGRLLSPIPIRFREAIPIAALGLAVNLVSAWLLSRGHHHSHQHGQGTHEQYAESDQVFSSGSSLLRLMIFESHGPAVFRLSAVTGLVPQPADVQLDIVRPDGARQRYSFSSGGILQSNEEIPEPHAFTVLLRIGTAQHTLRFAERGLSAGEHAHAHDRSVAARDNNLRAAVIHVAADAAVSVFVIVGLLLARTFGWLWMDPLAGIVGACVIASWSFGLVRDTGRVLLDMTVDRALETRIHDTVQDAGDRLTDLHVWRLGPGHLGAILAVQTQQSRDSSFYHEKLGHLAALSHVTVEVQRV
jgi:cation diffusion facilitator family transporter